ncbi:MAG: RtcB family protein [Lachnospiraceae bacterium]|jgi:tRNA-splicing ligase RtcB|nr:RtcB family protein [Lachnospiraceae bacterium]MCI9058271.1 RtcB family protein [Lachnospiraceae bacterium]
MFVLHNEKTRFPVKVWLESKEQLEENCLEQAYHLSQLPFIHKWVCLMPDTHAGKGMPIGGVIALKDTVIPNAVGVDIGCGMDFIPTNIHMDAIQEIQTGNGTVIQAIIGNIMRTIPLNTERYKMPQRSKTLDRAKEEMEKYEKNTDLLPLIEDGYFQVGSLGGGNHFIELQKDTEGYLCIMIHSGSRHMGKAICDYFHETARELNRNWHSEVKDEYRLAFLPVQSREGRQYISWMNLAMDYAFENRARMLEKVCEIVTEVIERHTDLKVEFGEEINCHHNYAALENHYDANVWVHRKGATRVREGELAVIPGAMGSYSYVVEGKGNKESFCSSSHGAGRNYSRTGAMQAFSVEQVMVDLKEQGIVLGKRKKNDVPEECRFAYKDIDEVMAQQSELVTPIRKLQTVGVVKG